MITVSVAIPCYKSARTIPTVVDELRATIGAREGFDYQIILVNDYPNDETFDVISALCRDDPKIVGVNLSRNFGQSPAKMAALPFVTGDVLVYMDDDGERAQSLFLLNPLYLFIRYFRSVIIEDTVPDLRFHLFIAVHVLIALGLGCWMYKKNNTKFLYYV